MKHILIVEDDRNIVRVLQELLTAYDYKVSVAMNGQEALDFLATEQKVNAIVLDLLMPVLDGFGFLAQRSESESLRKIPVVVQSASANPDHKKLIRTTYGCRFLEKPVDLDELMGAVEDCCK